MFAIKQDMRRECLLQMKSYSPEWKENASLAASCYLSNAPTWPYVRNVLAFMSLASEVGMEYVFEMAWESGKNVFIPRIDGKVLKFHLIHNVTDVLEGKYGIQEPSPLAEPWGMNAFPGFTLILVPGVTFDLQGNRLGRGGGYYDRFLHEVRYSAHSAGIPAPLCVGVSFEEQLKLEIPVDEWDENMDGLITNGRFTLF